ncbi:MFS transporter [Actinomadura sp. DC4]|uniref:MFS transporter n=1 Tax=Actinomadura sp. DC4 TaxID=3055069 RepID=UPI0025B05BF6|nr:MFS transporter [Actinomadura sp. DC4]MDN3354467.1 MFS transporter [Actinomadura sp. DC4]
MFRSRVFVLMWSGFVISTVGDQLYRVALAVGVSSRGAGALASLGLVLALPTALFGLLSGVLIDHTNKFRLLIRTDLLRAAIVAALGCVFLSARPPLPGVLALAGLLGVVSVLFAPGLQALLPEMSSGTDEMVAMDTWILGAAGSAAVIGPAVSGALLAIVDPEILMWADAATFVCSAVMLAGARRRMHAGAPRPDPPRAAGTRVKAAADGLRFVLRHDVLRPCFLTFPLMEFAAYCIPFLLPLIISAHYGHMRSDIYGLCLAALGGGRLLGMILVNRSALKRNRGRILRGNFILQGIPIVGVAAYGRPLLIPAALVVVGVASGAAQVSMSSYVQVEVAPQMRGRVFSSLLSMTSWLQPLGALVFGSVAAAFGASVAFALIGAILVLGGTRLLLSTSLASVR